MKVHRIIADQSLFELLSENKLIERHAIEKLAEVAALSAYDDDRTDDSSAIVTFQWLLDQYDVIFDKTITNDSLVGNVAAFYDELDSGYLLLRGKLEEAERKRMESYRFTTLLHAIESKSRHKLRGLLEEVLGETGGSSIKLPPNNIVGRIFIADLMDAAKSSALYALLILRSSLLRRDVSRTVLAIAEYANSHKQYPPNLTCLLGRTLRSVPTDPYAGQTLCYDPSKKKVFLDARASKLLHEERGTNGSDKEISWYVWV